MLSIPHYRHIFHNPPRKCDCHMNPRQRNSNTSKVPARVFPEMCLQPSRSVRNLKPKWLPNSHLQSRSSPPSVGALSNLNPELGTHCHQSDHSRQESLPRDPLNDNPDVVQIPIHNPSLMQPFPIFRSSQTLHRLLRVTGHTIADENGRAQV